MALTNPSYTVDTTFSAKNIATAASVYQFTAAASANVQFIVKLTNAAGGGDYIAYLMRQWGGVGAASVILPKTTLPAAAGETVIEFLTIPVDVKATDVIDVYIDGLAGDTSVNGNIRIVADNPSVFDPGTDSVTINAASVDAVWDELSTGHNVPNSYGRRLRQISANIIVDGTVVSSTNNTVTLDADGSAVSGSYDPSIITVANPATGLAQARMILNYDGPTKTATVDRDWRVNPTNTYTYTITAHPGREHVNEGKPQAATASTITLNSDASSIDNDYVGQIIFIRSGTGSDQVRVATAYNGTTKVLTVDEDWGTVPDSSSGYVMLPMLFGHVTTAHFNGNALQQFFTTNTGLEYADAVDGSVLKEMLDGVPPSSVGAAAIWSYAQRTLTQTLAQIIAAVTGTKLVLYRGDTNELSITLNQDISDYLAFDLFIKQDLEDRDDQAVLWVRKNVSGTSDGLKALYEYEQAGGVIIPAWANIAITNAATGAFTLTLEAEAAQHLWADDDLWYDIQKITPTKVKTLSKGRAEIEADVGNTIT